jgi:hypothetical protein
VQLAAEAAAAQGKFWPMHDAIYENQDLLSPALLTRLGLRLGLDMQRFTADVDSHRFLSKVKGLHERRAKRRGGHALLLHQRRAV